MPGKDLAITSNEIFDLPVFPDRLMIVGGGYIAVEFASVFARLGSAVTLVLRGENVLRGFDEDMRVGLRDALVEAGVDLRFGCMPTGIEKRQDGLQVALSDGASLAVDQVLVATGRAPNTAGLGLERAGVTLGAKGEVCVDAWSQTNVPLGLCGGRRDRPGGAHPRRDPRRARVRRHRLRRQDRLRRSRQDRDRRLHHAGDRHGRPERGAGAHDGFPRRRFRRDLPADEGDPVRPQGNRRS